MPTSFRYKIRVEYPAFTWQKDKYGLYNQDESMRVRYGEHRKTYCVGFIRRTKNTAADYIIKELQKAGIPFTDRIEGLFRIIESIPAPEE